MRAKDRATIASMPAIFIMRGACSLLDPRPKFLSAHDDIAFLDLLAETR